MYKGVKLFLTGDASLGLQYIPFAKSKLENLRALGLPYISKVFKVDDAEITVKISPIGDKIFIDVQSKSYLNCFLDTYPILPPQSLDISGDPIPYTPFQIGTQTVDELRYVIPPATTISPKMSFIRKVKTPSLKELTVQLPVEPGGPIPNQTTIRFREVYERFLPSKFTGLMRGIMQVAFSRYKYTNLSQVKVDYRFRNCYGVIQNPNTKVYYLLRITEDSIYYIPCGFTITTTGVAPGSIQDVLLIGTIDISKAIKIGTIPSGMGESWSDELGWAFSYTSPEASIVYQNLAFVGSQQYVTAELLTLSFGFNVQTGIPNQATLSHTGAKIIWNSHITSGPSGFGLFNIPVFGIPYPETGPARFYGQSVDFGQGTPVPLVRPLPYPGYVADSVPVYVYYTKSGRKLCTYSYRLDSGSSQTDPFNLSMYITGGWSGTKTFGGFVQYGFSVNGSSVPTASGTDSSAYTDYQIVNAGPTRNNVGSTINNTPTIDATDHLGAHHLAVPTATYPGSANETDIEAVVIANSGGGASVDSSLTLSITDRECAIVCNSYSSAGSSSSWTSTVAPCFIAKNSDPIGYPIGPLADDLTFSSAGMPDSSALFFMNGSFPLGAPWSIDAIHNSFGNLGSDGNITNEAFLSSASTYINFPRPLHGTFFARAPGSSVKTGTPATVQVQLYTATDVITLDSAVWNNNHLMFNLHPFPQLLDFKCTQAAYHPENIAYQTAPGSGGAPLVKFQGGEYAVENNLWGFVGVV